MIQAYSEVSDYVSPYAHLNARPGLRRIGRWDILRCMVTLAAQRHASSSARVGPLKSVYDRAFEPAFFAWRHSQVQSLGWLSVAPDFFDLTSTEKRDVTRRFGEAFAKYMSDRVLRVPQLFVIESAARAGVLTIDFLDPGKVRPREPDMIGQDRGKDWHVVEAKGSSYTSARTRVMRDGKKQAGNIKSIDGQAPATRGVCATFLEPDVFVTHLKDPDEIGDADVRVDREQFDAFYYGWLVGPSASTGIPRRERIDGSTFVLRQFETRGGRCEIGVAADIAAFVQDGLPVPEEVLDSTESYRDRDSDEYSIGSDGIAFRMLDGI